MSLERLPLLCVTLKMQLLCLPVPPVTFRLRKSQPQLVQDLFMLVNGCSCSPTPIFQARQAGCT